VLIPDRTVRAAKLAEVKRQVREEVQRLQAEMSKRSWPVRLGGACALASPALSIGTAVASGGTALALGLGVASAVAGVATAAAGLGYRKERTLAPRSPTRRWPAGCVPRRVGAPICSVLGG
jgi:phage tail tape-measure protein